MILADKIIENRKKNGWSQEELADMLDVSRQSVSKWESAQSVPDMKKILQLAQVFGVSTDYLLRDDMEGSFSSEAPIEEDYESEKNVSVTMEEANSFLAYNKKAASSISTGVMMCILSPVMVLLLGGLAEIGKIKLKVSIAEAIGTAIMLVMIAIAVAIFIYTGSKGKRYDYLENRNIDTQYGVTGLVKELKFEYAEVHTRRLIIGVMLCIVAAVPILLAEITGYTNNTDLLPILAVCGLMVMIAIGVKFIVLTAIRQEGFEKLLEEGDYERLTKRSGRYDGIYWGIAVAVYLGWSFISFRWDVTWIVWPIAGVVFALYREIVKAIMKKKKK